MTAIGTVNHVEHGAGMPIVALHGAGVDHREIEAALEAVVPTTGYRRVYPDLPGMGGTGAEDLNSNDDVVELLAGFVDGLGAGPVLLLGHSYGAYLARGVAARHPQLVRGVALVCPVGERTGPVLAHSVVREDADARDELEPALREGFDEYLVVRTRDTARRYRDHVVPGTLLVDGPALERIFSGWAIDIGTHDGAPECSQPSLVVAGRRDATVGYADAMSLLDRYPLASAAVVDDAGHALMHERPDVFRALVLDWLDRAGVTG